MATQTATRRRKTSAGHAPTPVRRRRGAAGGANSHGGTPRTPVAKAKKAAAGKATKTAAKKALVPSSSGHLVRRLAVRAIKKAASKALQGGEKAAARALQNGAGAAREAAVRVAEESRELIQRAMTPRVPVQRSIDVAAPLHVAWGEWMKLDSLPEGVHRVVDIERDGDELYGRVDAAGQPEWRAEVLDERDQDSFAWRSVDGSDCAGLITFHRLSDKLTRLELELDALPSTPAEAIALNTPIAGHRAEIELRRFKAHVEFMNPDTYEPDDTGD
jgi:uncharacterized membrane protein